MKDDPKDIYLQLKDISILIVSSDKNNANRYLDLFNVYFKKCYVEYNGQNGYNSFLQNHPDIVLTEYDIPLIDGLQMAIKIRKTDENIPIILNTKSNNKAVLLNTIKYKISLCINKHITEKTLLDTAVKELRNSLQEIEIKKEKLLMQAILEEFPDPIMVLDMDNNIQFANNSFKKNRFWQDKKPMKCYEALYGYPSSCDKRGHKCDSKSALKTGNSITGFHKKTDISGKRTYYNVKTIPLKDEKNKIYAVLKIIQDRSNDFFKEKKLIHKANYDMLTNIPNRALLLDRLEQSINRSNRNRSMFAVLFIDLDEFKFVNDIYGHLVGDRILKMATRRIKSSIRKIDTIARFGGDEFIVILEEIKTSQNIIKISKDILSKVNSPYILDENTKLHISCSIGIEMYYPHKLLKSKYELIKNADVAMYMAKKDGKGKFKFYKELKND